MCIVTKRNKLVHAFLYLTKDDHPSFLAKRVVGGATNITTNFGPTDLVGAKTLIFYRYSLVVPQP